MTATTAALAAAASCTPAAAAPTSFTAAGSNAAAIQTTVDSFRTALDATGRREVSWDDVGDDLADPNLLPSDHYQSTRGLSLRQESFNQFQVSADSSNSTSTPPVFGYAGEFQPFSPERIFARRDLSDFNVTFFVPGTQTAAAVRGFGAVFTDVDKSANATLTFIGLDGSTLGTVAAPAADNGLSFAGMTFDSAEVARVAVQAGNSTLFEPPRPEVPPNDFVALDDFIYGEPQAAPALVHFRVTTGDVAEGQFVSLPPQRAGNTQVPIMLRYEPVGGTATPGDDFGTATEPFFADLDLGAGVHANFDWLPEGDETAVVRMVSADGAATIDEPSTATVTIHDGPTLPAVLPAAAILDRTPPRLGRLRVSGRTLTFDSSEPGRVRTTLERVVASASAARTRVRYVRLPGALTKVVRAGRNRLTIPRRLAGRRIGAGRYRVTLVATDAARNRSRPWRIVVRLPR